MVVYSFYIFDRHAECIYKRNFTAPGTPASPPPSRPQSSSETSASASALNSGSGSGPGSGSGSGTATTSARIEKHGRTAAQTAADDARLVFGAVFSLRNMVRKLGGPDDDFISYSTAEYKLHYYETPTNLKFVMITDLRTNNLRVVLHQIYVGLYVEYADVMAVVKNPLSPVEHPGGVGVNCEMFELGLDQFIVGNLDPVQTGTMLT